MGRVAWLGLWLVAGCGAAAHPGSPPDLAAGFVSTHDGDLSLDGQRFRFVGANRYDLLSFPRGSGKFVCGNAYSDDELDRLVGELASSTGATVLRTWAFQAFTLGGTDFTTLDRLVAAAREHGLKLILTLENEWQDCTQPDPASADGRKSGAWFDTGYRVPLGADALSYRDYAQLLAARYRDEPTVALWQLLNEAESSDGAALLAFAADMAGVVKLADPRHLLSLGTIGTGQPGTAGDAYRALHAVGGIDVVEAHDYHAESVALPPPLRSDIADAHALGKPFFVGEAGIAAPPPMYPFTRAERATNVDAKIGAQFDAGTDGFLVWSFYDLRTDNHQGWDFDPTDPLAPVLKTRAAQQP